jgi:hypothetical protein
MSSHDTVLLRSINISKISPSSAGLLGVAGGNRFSLLLSDPDKNNANWCLRLPYFSVQGDILSFLHKININPTENEHLTKLPQQQANTIFKRKVTILLITARQVSFNLIRWTWDVVGLRYVEY